MIEQPHSEETLALIKEIERQPTSTQRDLSEKVGISLGKTNYLIKELIKKGFIKASNFSSNAGKIKKIHYFLTAKGFNTKYRLVKEFLQTKEIEYNRLKVEFRKIIASRAQGGKN